jgi:hypothetical protein
VKTLLRRGKLGEKNDRRLYRAPKGREKGAPVESYAVETSANQKLTSFDTQHDAIQWAKTEEYVVHVAGVRNTDKGNPDDWRTV